MTCSPPGAPGDYEMRIFLEADAAPLAIGEFTLIGPPRG